MDLTGYLVAFRVRDIAHPDAGAVHQTYCQDFVIQGICEHHLAEGLDGRPHLVVRVNPDHAPVFVALEHITDAVRQPAQKRYEGASEE